MSMTVEQLVGFLNAGCWPEYAIRAIDPHFGLIYDIKGAVVCHLSKRATLTLKPPVAKPRKTLREAAEMWQAAYECGDLEKYDDAWKATREALKGGD